MINDDSLFADVHACLEAGGRRRDAFDPNSWQACEPADVLTADKRALLVERMMPRATAFFSRLLKVRRVDGRLRLSGTVCGYVYFPCSNENGCSAVTKGEFNSGPARAL